MESYASILLSLHQTYQPSRFLIYYNPFFSLNDTYDSFNLFYFSSSKPIIHVRQIEPQNLLSRKLTLFNYMIILAFRS